MQKKAKLALLSFIPLYFAAVSVITAVDTEKAKADNQKVESTSKTKSSASSAITQIKEIVQEETQASSETEQRATETSSSEEQPAIAQTAETKPEAAPQLTIEEQQPNGSIAINGNILQSAADKYIDFASNDSNMSAFQSIIDAGYVATQAHPLSTTDGLNTHFYGHNPGVMSSFAANAQDGAVVSVKDYVGNVKHYRLEFVAKYPANTGIDENSWLHRAIWGNNGETITVQYCLPEENNIPIIWLGRAID